MSLRYHSKRARFVLSISLALVLTFASLAVFARPAQAASAKTVYVLTKVVESSTRADGSKGATITSNYTYFKTGLLKQIKSTEAYDSDNDGTSITTYKRAKSGQVTQVSYKQHEFPEQVTKMKVKKGKIIKETSYSVEENGTLKKQGVSVYTYDKKGNVKQSDYKSANGAQTSKSTYYKNGVIKKEVFKETMQDSAGTSVMSFNSSFDKKGNPTKLVDEYKSTDGYYFKTTDIYKNSYNKQGDLKKQVIESNNVETFNGNTTNYSDKTTITFKNTYNKKGKLTKCVATYKTVDSEGKTTKYTTTTTFKYKKVKVQKKYLPYIKGGKLSLGW